MTDEARGVEAGAALDALVDGLWRRVRDVLLVAERVGSFSFDAGTERPDEPARATLSDDEIDAAATDFVLRAFAVAADALNHRILAAACAADGVEVAALARETGAGALVVSERVNDLLQLGLIARALDSGRARATPAGEALVAIVRAAGDGLAARIRTGRDAAQEGSGRDGLPLL